MLLCQNLKPTLLSLVSTMLLVATMLLSQNLVAPRGFKEVLVPTWSEKNGQDDIIWYKAAKQANGDYKVTVRSNNHKGDSGLYNSHVYLVDNDGKFIGLGGKSVSLKRA